MISIAYGGDRDPKAVARIGGGGDASCLQRDANTHLRYVISRTRDILVPCIAISATSSIMMSFSSFFPMTSFPRLVISPPVTSSTSPSSYDVIPSPSNITSCEVIHLSPFRGSPPRRGYLPAPHSPQSSRIRTGLVYLLFCKFLNSWNNIM